MRSAFLAAGVVLTAFLPPACGDAIYHMSVAAPPSPPSPVPSMGNGTSPSGETIGANSRSLLLNGIPWFVAAGEFHYSRVPASEWRLELLKMKMAGFEVINAYAFWLHHEEVQGVWDWSGQRDLRAFVTLLQELGLRMHLRVGPWAHGEARSGGFPDWLVAVPGIKLRSNTSVFMGYVGTFFTQIAAQVSGLCHKDGGPVIAIQVENEYSGSFEYLLALKALAQGAGMDVPLWTRTGWPALKPPPPYGELLPYQGQYQDAFWSRDLHADDGDNAAFQFGGNKPGPIAPPDAGYPAAKIELGGGMPASYHRRILMHADDMGAGALVALGSGAATLGYYMAHGGQNPQGALTTLQESNALGWNGYNDLPIKSYDFYAPVGEYGQLRPHYHALRRVHTMLADSDAAWGPWLSNMTSTVPDVAPSGLDDVTTLRWAARSDGASGLLVVNNWQRNSDMGNGSSAMPAFDSVRFNLTLADGSVALIPPAFSPAVGIPSGAYFAWPFNLRVTAGGVDTGLSLPYAIAQPVAALADWTPTPDPRSFLMVLTVASGSDAAEFAFDSSVAGVALLSTPPGAQVRVEGGVTIVSNLSVALYDFSCTVALSTPSGITVTLLFVSHEDGLSVWKGSLSGRPRLFFTLPSQPVPGVETIDVDDGITVDPATPNVLRLRAGRAASTSVTIVPSVTSITIGSVALKAAANGPFLTWTTPVSLPAATAAATLLTAPGAPRVVPIGRTGVALPPDPDGSNDLFAAAAAVYGVSVTLSGAPLPTGVSLDLRLRFNYTGDVARVYLADGTGSGNATLLEDNFWNGRPFDLGLARYSPAILAPGANLTLAILPLGPDAPIYAAFGPRAAPQAVLHSVEVVQVWDALLTCNP